MKSGARKKAISLVHRLADLLRSNHIGLTAVIAIADAIAADARYNTWFYENVKSRGESVAMAKLDEYDCLTNACIEAIEKFDKAPSQKNLKELEVALRGFTKGITDAMVIAL